MAISVVGIGPEEVDEVGADSDIEVETPGGVIQSGDGILVFLHTDFSASTNTTPPDGFEIIANSAGNWYLFNSVWFKLASEDDVGVGSYTFSKSDGFNTGPYGARLAVVRSDAGAVLDGGDDYEWNFAQNDTEIVGLSLFLPGTSLLLFSGAVFQYSDNGSIPTAPGMVEQWDFNRPTIDDGFWLDTEYITASGTTGNRTITFGNQFDDADCLMSYVYESVLPFIPCDATIIN